MGVMEERRRIIAAQPHLVTASGETLSVAVAEPKLKKLAVTFAPVQGGSGTPSPSNVRPISGWSTIGVQFGVGKNLWDEQYPDISEEASTVRYRAVYVGTDPVTFSTTCPANATGYTVLYALPGAVTTGSDSARNGFKSGSPRTVTPLNGYVTIGYRASTGGADPRNYTTQIEYGTAATAYEPHTGTTVLTALGGTYYGGTVDLVSGTMTVTWDNIASYSGQTLPGRWLSSKDAYSAGGTPTTGAQVAYELATPQTVTLTPQTIAALRGQQTVTSPAGSVEISYWTH